MIVIIDYDMGNIASIKNMLHRIGYDDVIISGNIKDVSKADKLILPGVGSFDQGMRNLSETGLKEAIRDAVLGKNKPILGICLGMQLLGRTSEEGNLRGLELLSFDTIRFSFNEGYKIPHMGWNEVKVLKDIPLTRGMRDDFSRFYFVHSYHAICDNSDTILMTSFYGYEFTAAVHERNVYGVQFHPEKSHRYGMRLLENYCKGDNA